MTLDQTIETPGGVLDPILHYDITLVHDGHEHQLENAEIRVFLDDFGQTRYELITPDLTIGFLPGHVTGATLKVVI